MSIEHMISLIWYIIRDYHASVYNLKAVVQVATEQLAKQGYNVVPGNRGNITVDGIPYRIYKEKSWNSYDVRQTSE